MLLGPPLEQGALLPQMLQVHIADFIRTSIAMESISTSHKGTGTVLPQYFYILWVIYVEDG